jgi:hypothetical protein
MSRSDPIRVLLVLALAPVCSVPVDAWASDSSGNGSVTPVSSSSTSVTTMQAEIDDLRRRLDAIDWAQQPVYDPGVYRSFVPA